MNVKLGFKVTTNGTRCELNTILDACDSDAACSVAVDNSFCDEGVCQCVEGYFAEAPDQCILA